MLHFVTIPEGIISVTVISRRGTPLDVANILAVLVLFSCCPCIPGAAQDRINHPLAAYPFSGNARDESGNGNHGTTSGVVATRDRFGNEGCAYKFDGRAWVSLPSKALKNNEYTLSLWACLSKMPNPGEATILVSFGDETRRNQCVAVANGYGLPRNTGWAGSSLSLGTRELNEMSTGKLPELKVWYYLTMVRTLKSFSVYVNGEAIGHRTFNVEWPYYGDPTTCLIGMRCDRSMGFTGAIDDILIYNVGLSPEEVNSLYTDQTKSSVLPRGQQKK